MDLAGKVMSLVFNMLLRVLILFFPKDQASINLMAAVTIYSESRTQEYKICHCFHFPPSVCHKVMGPDVMILVF